MVSMPKSVSSYFASRSASMTSVTVEPLEPPAFGEPGRATTPSGRRKGGGGSTSSRIASRSRCASGTGLLGAESEEVTVRALSDEEVDDALSDGVEGDSRALGPRENGVRALATE